MFIITEQVKNQVAQMIYSYTQNNGWAKQLYLCKM